MSNYKDAKTAADFIMSRAPITPHAALVLGSGLGGYGERVEDAVIIPYEEIPGFFTPTVSGHSGRLVMGTLFGMPVAVMQGRAHSYEGHSLQRIALPVRALRLCGAQVIVLTNAAGGVNLAFEPGDLMMIEDHINYSGHSPLMGPNETEFGVRFPDMSMAYDSDLKQILLNAAAKLRIPLQRGVYMMFSGPQYETPAEVRFARLIGADAVGMSTVPEVVAARHAGMRVVGISCITNMAAGILNQPLSHNEVQETANRVQHRFAALLDEFIKELKTDLEQDA